MEGAVNTLDSQCKEQTLVSGCLFRSRILGPNGSAIESPPRMPRVVALSDHNLDSQVLCIYLRPCLTGNFLALFSSLRFFIY